MAKIRINFADCEGSIRDMNSVNNGPCDYRDINNLDTYSAAHIRYARTHDAAFEANYGGEHTVDVPNIFRDFDADENAESSYDFAATDEYLARIKAVGTEPFYRLGVKIENGINHKYNIYPPKDPAKWARICEHIVRHYNCGWDGGFNYGITYWEIWNEPDGHAEMWLGTDAQYFELYRTAASYLKSCHPDIKVGGPAMCWIGPRQFTDDFLSAISAPPRAPLDFISWHCYGTSATAQANSVPIARAYLHKYGYDGAETILNEWNWVRDFHADMMKESYRTMQSVKGAAYVAAVMCECQRTTLDHLMYYDARPSIYNGLFADSSFEPKAAYWAIRDWGEMYGMDAVKCADDAPVYSAASKNGSEWRVLLSYYTDDPAAGPVDLELDLTGMSSGAKREEFYLTDASRLNENTLDLSCDADSLTHRLEMSPNSFLFVKLTSES